MGQQHFRVCRIHHQGYSSSLCELNHTWHPKTFPRFYYFIRYTICQQGLTSLMVLRLCLTPETIPQWRLDTRTFAPTSSVLHNISIWRMLEIHVSATLYVNQQINRNHVWPHAMQKLTTRSLRSLSSQPPWTLQRTNRRTYRHKEMRNIPDCKQTVFAFFQSY